MLTPDKIAAFNKITGGSISPLDPSAGPTRADQIRNMETQQTSNPIQETGKNYADNIMPAADDVMGKGNIGTAVDKFGKGDILGGTEDATMGVASDAVKAVFAPIAAPIKTLLDHVAASNKENPSPTANVINSPEAQAARKSISDWATANPQLAKTLGDAFTVGTAGLGSGALDTSVADAAAATKNAVTDTITGAKNAVGATKDAIVGAKNAVTEAPSGAIDNLAQDASTMTQKMKTQATDEDRQVIGSTKTGGTEISFKPTKEITRAQQIMSDPAEVKNPITPKDKPNLVLAKVKGAISQKGAEAEKFLEQNPVKITNKEEASMFDDMRARVEKTSTKAEMAAYDEQIKLFQKQLQGRPGGYTTSNYYKALKDYEANVASKFSGGKEALIDPEGIGSAKIQAAADLRATVRDLIGDKHPEFKPKMYDLTSLYEARDNALFNSSKVKSQSFLDKNPRIKATVKAGIGAAGLEGTRKIITGSF